MHLMIVEDLATDRDLLADLVRQDCLLHRQPVELSFYPDGETFLEKFQPGTCDGIFLDILMGGLSGIDTARRLREADPLVPVIFTTTEPDFALDGFSVHAMDYLVKPLDGDKVAWCMGQLRKYLAAPAFLSIREISGWGHSTPVQIPLDDILYAQYQNHIVDIHTVSGVCCTRLSFQDFIDLLPHTGRFYVCGRGLVVNLSQVEQVGDGVMRLGSGERLLFSRSRNQELKKAFTEWVFACSRKGGWG